MFLVWGCLVRLAGLLSTHSKMLPGEVMIKKKKKLKTFVKRPHSFTLVPLVIVITPTA